MEAIILECPPRGRFHFGNIALDENTSLDDTAATPHSDTLFSAIIRTAHHLAPNLVNDLVKEFENKDGRVRISSAFFCVQIQDGYIFLLPKPIHADLWKVPAGKDRKAIRRIQFISKMIWEEGLTPDQWFDAPCLILKGGIVIHEKEASSLPSEFIEAPENPLYSLTALPKVRVHAPTQEDGFFYQTSVQVASYAGPKMPKIHYYFLLDNRLEGDLASLFEGVLEMLVDSGIGGERSVGCGQLTGKKKVPFGWAFQPAEQVVSLSLVNPAQTELSRCRYFRTVLRGGRIIRNGGPLKRVRMLLEGALLSSSVQGLIADISANIGTYKRNGRHFYAPIHEKWLVNET